MNQQISPLFTEAFRYAAEVHGQQTRKGSRIPYISHLMAVSALVIEHGGNEREAIAALLHDMVEDQGGVARLDEIRSRFGDEVAEIVAGCTDAWTEPKPDWQKRKEEHIRHLEQAPPSVLLVSAADKLHNARAILSDYREVGERLWERFSGGKNGTMWYYRDMLAVYRKVNANRRLVAELERVVRELELLVN